MSTAPFETSEDGRIIATIVIPTRNNADRLRRCLASIFSQDFRREAFEVIVVDNASEDDSKNVADDFAGVRYLTQNRILSPYASKNVGIRQAAGKYIVLLDANCAPQERWLQAGLDQMVDSETDVGVADVQFEFSITPTAAELADSLINIDVQHGTPGTNLFVRRQAFATVGLFPDDLRSNGDTVWIKKLKSIGGTIRFLQGAKVWYPARRLLPLLRKELRLGFGNRTIRLDQGASRATILRWAIWNMRPIQPSFLREIICRRGGEIHWRHFWLIWVVIALCRVCRGLGRAGILAKLAD